MTTDQPWMQPVVHRDVTLLVVSDPHVMEELRSAVDLDRYVLAVVGPGKLVIDPSKRDELARDLDAAGMEPLLRRARPPRTERSVGRVLDAREDPTVELPPRDAGS